MLYCSGYTRNARESSTGRRYHHRDTGADESWTRRERRLKSHSEANLLASASYDDHGRTPSARRLSRSNGHLAMSNRDLLRGGAFVNRGMEMEEEEEDGEEEMNEEELAMEEEMAAMQEEEEEERRRRARSASR